jgi:hypothetical protein
VGLTLWIAVAGCGAATATHANSSPASGTSPSAQASPSTATASAVRTADPIPTPIPVPPPSLMCPGHYQSGHPLLSALEYSQAGYDSLVVLDVANPLAPSLLCRVNYPQYPIQPMQWLSASEFALVQPGRPSHLIDVDVARQSITTIRELSESAHLASISTDRAWLATMEAGADGANVARLYGPAGARTLAIFPPAGGHGGTIYGFGGPNIELSPDGSLVLAVDYEANYVSATSPDLQVFDLQGSLLFSAAKGIWAVWDKTALYYDNGGKVYRWVPGAAPVAVSQSDWLEPARSPDGLHIAYLTNPGYAFKLDVLDTRSGIATEIRTSGQRIDPLFVTPGLMWTGELQICDNCYGGINPTGKVFAYDVSTGSEQEVNLPVLLSPLAGASLSSGG